MLERPLLEKGLKQMTVNAELADRLTKLLMLAHPPVAVSFRKDTPSADAEAVVKQPAGCCYWAPAAVPRRGSGNREQFSLHPRMDGA